MSMHNAPFLSVITRNVKITIPQVTYTTSLAYDAIIISVKLKVSVAKIKHHFLISDLFNIKLLIVSTYYITATSKLQCASAFSH